MIRSLTSTNSKIQIKDDHTAELLKVLRQCLSLCNSEMLQSILWVEHSGKLIKRRKVHKKKCGTNDGEAAGDSADRGPSSVDEEKTIVTTPGQQIKKPAWFNLIEFQVHSQNKRKL